MATDALGLGMALAAMTVADKASTGPMLVVALLGLGVNLIGWRLLREGAAESLNLEGALLEVVADLIGSLGVVAAALIVRFTDYACAGPIIAAGIGLFILPRAYRLGRKAIRVLVQAAPEGLDVGDLWGRLSKMTGVEIVHDLHVCTLTSGMPVASAHLIASSKADRDSV